MDKTTIHFCINLDALLKDTLTGGALAKVIAHDDGTMATETEIYELVANEKAKGHKYFTGCNNVDAEGRCAGHAC